MTERLRAVSVLAATLLLACCGCAHVPGSSCRTAEVVRPDQQLDFHVLYKQNCSGCHGDNGRGGAAIPLNNPAYLAVAGAQNLRTAAAKGLPGTLMPAFAQSSGGMLTDAQVDALVQGMIREWSRPSDFCRSRASAICRDDAGQSQPMERKRTRPRARAVTAPMARALKHRTLHLAHKAQRRTPSSTRRILRSSTIRICAAM